MKKILLTLCFLINPFINSYGLYEFKARNYEKEDRRIYLKGKNSDYSCNFNKIIMEAYLNGGDLGKLLKETSFDPCCFPKSVHRIMSKSSDRINGITVGVDESIGIILDQEGGLELAMVQLDEDEIQVGLVGYTGLAAGIAIGDLTPAPISAGITRGILKGKCHSLNDYLGHFLSIQIMGQQKSLGTDKVIINHDARPTGCNADQTVIGLTSEFVGGSATKYSKFSEFITLKGPRIKKLIAMFNMANKDSIIRQEYNRKGRTYFGGLNDALKEMLHMGFEVNFNNKVPEHLISYPTEEYLSCSGI